MSVLVINEDNFEKEVLNSDKAFVLDFYADWCGPCKIQSPIIDNLSEENNNIKVGKINVDDNPELAEKYGIMSIPTILVIKNGEVTNQFVGVTEKEKLKEVL